ncbi:MULTISPECIES: IS66 family transposase [Rhizobium]|uniref:Regulator of replication initiation timing n=2 Tax=Rhizobium TaxID=379 RepID=A0A7W7EQ17_9HYPH|nr:MULTISPECIES: transposase [Rhizobium]MBB4571818.1 regulator of replication initiation timing [Rhizobium leucaenae]MBB6305762.1 regulator of replication initiation timing [Rhizobium leucaenae]MDK4743141.1 transposase [Rhizobium sp. CNPSo 3464]SCB47761.1 Transposase IS66 family protein [Rhizobium lusitanum]
MTKRLPSPEHAGTLSLNALRSLVSGLLERSQQAEARLAKLEADNIQLREENAALRLENTRLKVENQLLRDEIARLKNLPPRPPFRPSGMDKATDIKSGDKQASKKKPRGPKLDVKRVSREEIVRTNAPAGSRFKGYRSVYVRDLVLKAELVHYRRECWVTPDGKTVLAPLPMGTVGGYGINLRRLCLMLHTQGQVTTARLTTLLNDIGIDISKRQILRLLTRQLDGFVAEDAAVLHAGLVSSSYVTVDDTGAWHSHNPCYATHIGGPNFTVFRTTKSKSRLNFLSLLRGGYQDYVLNDAAFDYLKERRADASITAVLRAFEPQRFCNQVPFMAHLAEKGIDIFDRQEIGTLAEAGLWGSIRHHGLMGNTVIVSDDAGQFRVGNHALCWVHAERLLQKLMPGTAKEERSLTMVRDLVWRFYKALKAYKQTPSPRAVPAFRRRFDRIFGLRTGYEALDKLLERLHRRKSELLKVLDHPEIPLHTNASENALRSFVTKRKISGGTMSRDGRVARDTMLGLMKTCQKLGLSFYHYLGDRLGIGNVGQPVPPLPAIILARA